MNHPRSLLRLALVVTPIAIFLFLTSGYIALRLGALPWPIMFSIVVSAGLLKVLYRELDIQQVNIAQAGASMGGLMAAAVTFILPGLYLSGGTPPSVWTLALLGGLGALMGIILAGNMYEQVVEAQQLPFPAGQAGGELMLEGFKGGHLFRLVILAGLVTAAITLFRDALELYTLTLPVVAGISLTFLLAPMGVAGGYILGLPTGINWLAGALLATFLLDPVSTWLIGAFPDMDLKSSLLVQNAGMGLVLGAGVAQIYLHGGISGIRFSAVWRKSRYGLLAVALLSLILLWIAGLPLWAAVITILAGFILVPVAVYLTGSTNLDPLEQFGILAALAILGMGMLTAQAFPHNALYIVAFFIAMVTAVAGDMGHDLKSAAIVGTPLRYILRIDLIAALVVVPFIPLTLHVISSSLQGELFTNTLPAPQARMVHNTFSGQIHLPTFVGAFLLAILLETSRHFFHHGQRQRLLLIPLGIGIFLGFPLGFVIGTGGVIRGWMDRHHAPLIRAGIVLAAGVMGGESLMGFLAATVKVFTSWPLHSLQWVSGWILSLSTLALIIWMKRRYRSSGD